MKRQKQIIPYEQPFLTDVLIAFFKTTKRNMMLPEIVSFFQTFAKNPDAPLCVKNLTFSNIEGNMYCFEIEDILNFSRVLEEFPCHD